MQIDIWPGVMAGLLGLTPFILTMAAIALVAMLLYVRLAQKPSRQYKAVERLCSPAEMNFAHQLLKALPEDHYLVMKVRLADVCTPTNRKDLAAFSRISQKHLDFVVIRRDTSEIACAIELDDRSHRRKSSSKRDAVKNEVLASAGVQLHRVVASKHYQAETQKIVALLRSDSDEGLQPQRARSA